MAKELLSSKDPGAPARPAPYLPGLGAAPSVAEQVANPVVDAVMRLYGGALVVVDAHRRIVARNTAYLELLGVERPAEVLGLRLGEAAGCVHAHEGPAGCGTTPACRTCGAAMAMTLALQGGEQAEAECAVAAGSASAPVDLALHVRAVPLGSAPPLALVVLSDVGPERRRAALERALTHGLANLAAALGSAGEELLASAPAALRPVAQDVQEVAARLAGEIEVQRVLATAHPSSWRIAPRAVPARALLADLRERLQVEPAAVGRRVVLGEAPAGLLASTQRQLTVRVLLEGTLNALEATPPGGEVRVAAAEEGGRVTFTIWSAPVIPASLRPRIFQRYFTTKPEPGRGQGGYLMRLLGERALGGEVGFRSEQGEGTTFHLRLPRVRPGAPPGPALPLD